MASECALNLERETTTRMPNAAKLSTACLALGAMAFATLAITTTPVSRDRR